MNNLPEKEIELLFAGTSLVLLVVGYFTKNGETAFVGAILYLLSIVIPLVFLYYLPQKRHPEETRSQYGATKWIQVGMTLTGLIMTLAEIPLGYIIWVGTVVVYLASGFVIEHASGTPMKMWYGGWRIDQKRLDKNKLKK